MIEIKNLTKSYRVKSGRHYVFKDVSATFPEDANIGIIGPNGGGKSTFLRLLGGIDHPDSGHIISNKSCSWPLGLKGGFVGHLSGRENCRMVCNLYGLDARTISRKLEEIKERSGIGEYFEEPVEYYSSGMGGRLGFSLSMSFDFDYFLIDEITSVGDAHFKALAKKTLEEKAKKSRVIMVSHNMGDLKKFCDVAVLVSGGKFRFFENIDDAIRAYLPQTQEATAENEGVILQSTVDQLNLASIELPTSHLASLDEIEENMREIESKLANPLHKLPPDESFFFQSLGQVYEKLQDHNKAQKAYEKAVEANPYQIHSLLRLADFFSNEGDWTSCERALSAAESVDPKNLRVLIFRIQQQLRKKHWEDALKTSELALRVAPTDQTVLYLRARTLAGASHKQEAISAITKALEIGPENTNLYLYLAKLLAEHGDFKIAQLATQKARLTKKQNEIPAGPDFEKLSHAVKKLNRAVKI